MGLVKNILVALLVVFLAAISPGIYTIVGLLDTFKPTTHRVNDHKCKVITHTFDAATATRGSEEFASTSFEDVVYVTLPSAKPGNAANRELAGLSCSGDFAKLATHPDGPDATVPQGECVLILSDGSVRGLPLDNFPPSIHFHAHGIFVEPADATSSSSSSGTLHRVYVINHAYGYGGERIEVFTLAQRQRRAGEGGTAAPSSPSSPTGGSAGAGAPPLDLVLHHEGSIAPPFFTEYANGILNDLVVDLPRRVLYVTKYLISPDPIKGRLRPDRWTQRLRTPLTYLQMLSPIAAASINTTLLRCTLPESVAHGVIGIIDSDVLKCTAVADSMTMANGVNQVILDTTRFLFVNDVIRHEVRVYATPLSTGSNPDHGPLQLVDRITLRHAVDNIEVSWLPKHVADLHKKGIVTLFAGAIVNISAAAKFEHNDAVRSAGGSTLIQFRLRENAMKASGYSVAEVEEKDILIHDGSKMGGVSSSLLLPDETTTAAGSGGDAFLVTLGSWKARGLMQCKITDADDDYY